MTSQTRQWSFRRDTLTAILLMLACAAIAIGPSVAQAAPYGYAPESLTWTYPPNGSVSLAPGHSAIIPRFSDIDAWRVSTNGTSVYRYRQAYTRRAFVRKGRTVARYRCNVSYCKVRSLTSRTVIRVYYWEG